MNSTISEFARFLPKQQQVGQGLYRLQVAFARVVDVERPSPQRLTILGLDIDCCYKVVEPSLWQRLMNWRKYGERFRYSKALAVEVLDEAGSSVGGSLFCVICNHGGSVLDNRACFDNGFEGHVACATRGEGMGVDGRFQRQGLATEMYRLAMAYAARSGWRIVPASHVTDLGKKVWRKLLQSDVVDSGE